MNTVGRSGEYGGERKGKSAWGLTGRDYGSWMSNPVFYMVGASAGPIGGTGRPVLCGVPHRRTGYPVLCCRGGAAGPAGLDHMDPETVRLRGRRDDGAGTSGRPLPFGFQRPGQPLRGGLRLRGAVHPGGAYLAGGRGHRHRLLGCGLRLRPGPCARKTPGAKVWQPDAGSSMGTRTSWTSRTGALTAVVSNYVYHNVMGADKRALLLETLRVLKKGGVFRPQR